MAVHYVISTLVLGTKFVSVHGRYVQEEQNDYIVIQTLLFTLLVVNQGRDNTVKFSDDGAWGRELLCDLPCDPAWRK